VSRSERLRWIQAFTSLGYDENDERIYEEWGMYAVVLASHVRGAHFLVQKCRGNCYEALRVDKLSDVVETLQRTDLAAVVWMDK